jgi:hypothetical protein
MKLATRNLLIVGIGVLIALVVLVGFFTFVPPPPPPRAAPPPPRPFPEASPALSPPFSLPKQSAGTPPSSVELVDEILRNLSWGNIAFNVPTEMRYAEPHFVELLLSPSLSAADLQAQLEQKAGAESAHIQVSNRMEAKLTGLGFKIEALQPDLQAVTSQQTTRWKWEVTPTEHGSRTLNLALSALIDVDGRDTPFVVQTFGREIRVYITIPQRVSGFIQKNWQWLWAVIVVPIAGYLWRRRKKAANGS